MGFILMYAGCPMMWGSKMETLIALSMTEAEYITLSIGIAWNDSCIYLDGRNSWLWLSYFTNKPQDLLQSICRQPELHQDSDKPEDTSSY